MKSEADPNRLIATESVAAGEDYCIDPVRGPDLRPGRIAREDKGTIRNRVRIAQKSNPKSDDGYALAD
jgi:hypothetical protein